MTTQELRTGTRLSIDEFLALGETDQKMELGYGKLYLMPTPNKDHQFLQHWTRQHLENYIDSFSEPPLEVHHEITTVLSRESHLALEPDIVVILAGRTDIGGVVHVEGIPDIVVEILSSDRSRDLVRKRQIYAESGVQEYWIIDPAADTVSQLALQGGEYTERATLGVDDTLSTPLLPGLEIPLGAIFRHPRRPAREV